METINHQRPETMTAQARTAEVAKILADALLRLKTTPDRHAPESLATSHQPLANRGKLKRS